MPVYCFQGKTAGCQRQAACVQCRGETVLNTNPDPSADHHRPHISSDGLTCAVACELSTRPGVVHFGSCEGGALPVIMSITCPRETHDYCTATTVRTATSE